MARTNTRTQMILGMLLNCARADMENLPDIHSYMVNDQSYEALNQDQDYMKAQELLWNMIEREISKNDGRIDGSGAYDMAEIDAKINGEEE